MTATVSILCFYISLMLFIWAYAKRDKAYHKKLLFGSAIACVVGFLLFLAWGILRNFS